MIGYTWNLTKLLPHIERRSESQSLCQVSLGVRTGPISLDMLAQALHEGLDRMNSVFIRLQGKGKTHIWAQL
jgi:hypothetical protein